MITSRYKPSFMNCCHDLLSGASSSIWCPELGTTIWLPRVESFTILACCSTCSFTSEAVKRTLVVVLVLISGENNKGQATERVFLHLVLRIHSG